MTDFDIHGILRVRLVDPTPGDVATIVGRLGPPEEPTGQDPDITIRFDTIPPLPNLRYLGVNATGFTEEGFYLLSWKTGKIQARIPFEHIGNQCELVYQRGLGSAPLLDDILNFTLLRKNFLPVHASAFIYDGTGILVTGWTKGGKTEALLSFANHGAQYVGDEWVVLSSDGRTMFGLPFPITLWDWQFKYIPTLMPRVPLQRRILFKSIHCLDALYQALGPVKLRHVFPATALGEALPALRRQLKILVSPRSLFPNGGSGSRVTVDKLLLMMSHRSPRIELERCHPLEVAQRMKYSNETEQESLLGYYKAFRFAFPHLRNEFLETYKELQGALLSRALEGKEAFRALHPYPVPFDELFTSLRSVCKA